VIEYVINAGVKNVTVQADCHVINVVPIILNVFDARIHTVFLVGEEDSSKIKYTTKND